MISLKKNGAYLQGKNRDANKENEVVDICRGKRGWNELRN